MTRRFVRLLERTMASLRNGRTTVLALGLVLLLGAAPLAAEAGGPVLEYLQGVVKPLLDSIAARVVATNTAVTALTASVAGIDAKVEDAGRVRTVAVVIPTNENSSTGRNLDLAAGDLGGWDKIRRYTVSIHWGALAAAPPGVDAVFTNNCVTDDAITVCRQLAVDTSDPSGRSGVAVDPYAGVNSFVRVLRGADGLGPVDVYVNAYIEVEQ